LQDRFARELTGNDSFRLNIKRAAFVASMAPTVTPGQAFLVASPEPLFCWIPGKYVDYAANTRHYL